MINVSWKNMYHYYLEVFKEIVSNSKLTVWMENSL